MREGGGGVKIKSVSHDLKVNKYIWYYINQVRKHFEACILFTFGRAREPLC